MTEKRNGYNCRHAIQCPEFFDHRHPWLTFNSYIVELVDRGSFNLDYILISWSKVEQYVAVSTADIVQNCCDTGFTHDVVSVNVRLCSNFHDRCPDRRSVTSGEPAGQEQQRNQQGYGTEFSGDYVQGLSLFRLAGNRFCELWKQSSLTKLWLKHWLWIVRCDQIGNPRQLSVNHRVWHCRNSPAIVGYLHRALGV